MIIDTSALLAILYREEDAEWLVTAMVTAPVRRMSAANFLETAINVDTHGDPLSRATGEPLLFKGNDFSNTDLVTVTR